MVTNRLLLPLVMLTALSKTASAQPVVINFDDLPAKTFITTELASRGVVFPFGAYVDTDARARSGKNVLRSQPTDREFDSAPLVITFRSGQMRVQFYGAPSRNPAVVDATLLAFDGAGNLIAMDSKVPDSASLSTLFSVTSSTASIYRIELRMGVADFEMIDDLEIEGNTAPPIAPPPVVKIITPTNGAELDVNSVAISGTVTGEGLLPSATIYVDELRPPWVHAPQYRSALPLSGLGSPLRFDTNYGTLALGPITITVEARNAAGASSDTVRVTNLPKLIRDRYNAGGGQDRYGDFRYGLFRGDCRIAVFAFGAFAARGSTATLFDGPILEKWLSVTDSLGEPSLGCPKNEQRTLTEGALAQDFDRGRIYANLLTGSHYVPLVFVDAIERQGGESATGVPLSDPSSSIGGTNPTWLFQRFRRPELGTIDSTLEIRGTPPELLIERQGGDMLVYNELGLPVTRTSPTIWQRYLCADNEGRCAVPLTPSATAVPVPIVNAKDNICGGQYPFSTTTEWRAILGNYVLTPVEGIVSSSHLSGEDNPWTHDYSNDWDMLVRPLSHGPVDKYPSLMAGNRQTIEIEFEDYFDEYWFVRWSDRPQKGDLLYVSGRWIIDCAHVESSTGDERSEIHPPWLMTHSRTETYRGTQATLSQVWINGFYTGEPTELTIYPPPRPTPDSTLVVATDHAPEIPAAGYGVTVTTSGAGDHIVIRASAPRREVTVRSSGEMRWQIGREYSARFHVYWTTR